MLQTEFFGMNRVGKSRIMSSVSHNQVAFFYI